MHVAAVMMRPLRPDLPGVIEAGIAMHTSDMSFDPAELRRGLPAIELTRIDDVMSAMCTQVGASNRSQPSVSSG